MRILISEDDELIQLIYREIFIGEELTFCLNGKDTIKAASENHFDLLVQDIGLPDMLGYKVSLTILDHLESPNKLSIAIVSAHLVACLCQEDVQIIQAHPSIEMFTAISKGGADFFQQIMAFKTIISSNLNFKKAYSPESLFMR